LPSGDTTGAPLAIAPCWIDARGVASVIIIVTATAILRICLVPGTW